MPTSMFSSKTRTDGPSEKHLLYDDGGDGDVMRIPGNSVHLPLCVNEWMNERQKESRQADKRAYKTYTSFKNFNFSHEHTIRKTLMSRQNMFSAHVRRLKRETESGGTMIT